MQLSFLKCTRRLADGFLLYRSKFSQNGKVLGIRENKQMCSRDNESCFICFSIIGKAYTEYCSVRSITVTERKIAKLDEGFCIALSKSTL